MDTSDSQEGACDETISLSDVLVARDSCLPEDELWALCRECCLVLEVVNKSPDMFQTLCVTPDTVAFDQIGNVCFLDLDVDPEPIYLPPEYSTSGNNYKAHLFSLGMTLLYAAEYNVDQSKDTVSPELREILGRMTADEPTLRPDLESTIILCEEQLCGQSSQEVCCGIAAIVGFGIPTEENFDEAPLATASFPVDEDYSHADSFIQSEQGDETYCDDIPDLTEDISQAESLPLSEQETVVVTEETTESHDESLSEATDMETRQQTGKSSSHQHGKHTSETPQTTAMQKPQEKPELPKKPDIANIAKSGLSESSTNLSVSKKGELTVSELYSESESSELSQNDRRNKLANGTTALSQNKTDPPKPKERRTSSSSSKKDVQRDNNQNITFIQHDEAGQVRAGDALKSHDSISSDKGESTLSREKGELTRDQTGSRNKRNRRKQGLTITDILEALDRALTEEELWALCKEGTSALQRKKKHLPAYLCPDTLVIRESGNLSFKAIPEEKPLEVIFMAPELQEKGELTEKTCLFGLSVTLRCAAGKKYGTVGSLKVSQQLRDLLQFLSDTDPVKRPELVDIAKACNEHSNGASSDSLCARLFQDAYTAMEEKIQKQQQQKENVPKPESPKMAALSAFKPAAGASFQPVKPVPIGSNSSAFASTGAFQPIPKKPEPKREIGEPRIPSAFSSPATHFKPIVLQQTAATTNEKPSVIKEEKSQHSLKDKDKPPTTKTSSSTSSTSSTQKKPSSASPDQEKEVVKKLKELKKNLMKHKQQPSMAKEIENEDKVSDSKGSENSAPSKKSLPPTPKKSSDRSKRRQSSGALEALLKEIQKQGSVPDTNSLASAIASVLQSHLNPSEANTGASKPQTTPSSKDNPAQATGELDMTVKSAQAALNQDQMLQNIPAQYHSQLVGQTIPIQNMISGMPQFQFQQDPVTGYLQLVPVVAMRPQSVHSNSGSVHSSHDFTSPMGSGNAMKDINSPDLSPKVYHNQSDLSNPSAISDNSGTRGKAPHGRTAKDLVQRTANMRAKNLGRPSPSNVHMLRDSGNGLYKWKSDHALDRVEPAFYSDSERAKHNSYSSLAFQNRLQAGYVCDDSMLNPNSFRNAQMTGLSRPFSQYGLPANYRSPDDMNRHINSTMSSPSPSTHDSGIGGMNHGVFRGNLQTSDASLMERLLSNVNVKQQRIVGRIVHLLREEFAFDGYMENGVEDLAMAEYISSLGELKWETFKSAIMEKYCNLYWKEELLSSLFAAVNVDRSTSVHRSSSGQGRVPVRQQLSGNRDDDSSGLSETNDGPRTATQDSHLPTQQLSPLSQKSKRNTADLKPLDTSDSTDSETYNKRRRIKTKHELDKRKSGSNNLLNDSSNSVPMDMTVQSGHTGGNSVNGLDVRPPKPPNPVNSTNSANLPSSNTNRQHPVDGSIKPNVRVAPPQSLSINNSHDSSVSQKPSNQVSPQGVNQLKANGVNQAHPTMNGSANHSKSVLSREMSMSSHSSSQSDLDRDVTTETVAVDKRGHVVYHWAMIQLSMSQEMERFMQDIDEQNSKMLNGKLSTLEQQLKMEKRMRRKTQKFYKTRVEASKTLPEPSKDKTTKGERNQIMQVAKDITEMTRRINFIDLCRTHIQMLLAELQGIDVSYLYSIATCAPEEPLQLQPRPDNPLLQFQTLREPHTGCEIQALHAGTPDGLMAYLFASTALSEGYIQQFLFCYRYFTTATEVLHFLITRYVAAVRSGSTEVNIGRLQQRVVDLLHYWLEGYFTIDFRGHQSNINKLRDFIKEHIGEDSEKGQSLQSLLSNCISGNMLELSSADPDESEMLFWQREEPKLKQANPDKKKEWESFRSLIRGKTGAKEKTGKSGKVKISAVVVERRRKSLDTPESLPLAPVSRRTDAFMLADYSALCLAEQLCLMEQAIFQQTHPVHYLDSKSRGVGVALTIKGMRTPAPVRRSGIEESFGLFREPLVDNSAIQKMIDYGQEVSHWVAGEIVACSNPKVQIAVLSKFLFIGHGCMELRNFATCMSILDGLENLIVKQLPAWKHLPTKCSNIMEELTATRMFLKNDPLSLMQQGKDCHLYPTIPSPVFFLLHIQQAEIGGFKLANQMYKWGKMRSICQVIEQIRVYREHLYGFETDSGLQDTLRRRIHEMAAQDIQDLAMNNDINYQKLSSATGISNAFKKMKGKFQAK